MCSERFAHKCFERGLETITLEISNLAAGSSTVIEVPVIEIE